MANVEQCANNNEGAVQGVGILLSFFQHAMAQVVQGACWDPALRDALSQTAFFVCQNSKLSRAAAGGIVSKCPTSSGTPLFKGPRGASQVPKTELMATVSKGVGSSLSAATSSVWLECPPAPICKGKGMSSESRPTKKNMNTEAGQVN